MTEQQIIEKVNSLTLDELCGQVMCFEITEEDYANEEFMNRMRKIQPGGIYVNIKKPESSRLIAKEFQSFSKVPCIVAADAENGLDNLPMPMAWGATDDPELIERTNYAVAKNARIDGINMALAPVVDINYNYNNCIVNTRAISDSPEQVIKIGTAIVRGFQRDSMIAACCKHFPGDGVDQRNQHFLTNINSLSKEEWMNSYGRVYKAMIDAGTMAVMVAHIALPAFDEKVDDIIGYPPGTLSKNLMQGLLKGRLGFNGCIVSDAMSMVGACAMVDTDRLSVEFLKAGGDLLLFPLPEDVERVKNAVLNGELSMERLKDAVIRIWRLKNKISLFDKEFSAKIKESVPEDLLKYGKEISEKSITLIRDAAGIFPITDMKAGSRVLHVIIKQDDSRAYTPGLEVIDEELKKRGVEVTTMKNPLHYDVQDAPEKYDYVLFNIKIDALNFTGGTLRIGWVQAMALWRGYLLRHPKVIFTSFGDPYKLYDYPFAKTYLNAYCWDEETQKTFVRILFGELPITGKSPVGLEGFFERRTD